MKIDKGTVVIYSLLMGLVIYMIYGQIEWKTKKKRYAIAYVYRITSHGTAGVSGDYYFTLNNKKKQGDVGNPNTNINKYFIVEFIEGKLRMNRIRIEIPIDPEHIVPQPIQGWEECPINKDGTIKQKYKRRDKSGEIIKFAPNCNLSAEDSARILKTNFDK